MKYFVEYQYSTNNGIIKWGTYNKFYDDVRDAHDGAARTLLPRTPYQIYEARLMNGINLAGEVETH